MEEYQKMNQDQRQYPWQASQWSMPSFSETAYWAGGPVWGIDPYGNIFAIGWLVNDLEIVLVTPDAEVNSF